MLAVILVMALQLGFESAPIWEEEGAEFVFGTDWNPVPGRESYGALPYVLGTLITSALALALGFPLSIGIAMLVMIMPKRLGRPLGYLVDLIEAVPSVVFGLWGLFVFRLYFRDIVEKPLHDAFGDSIYLFRRDAVRLGHTDGQHNTGHHDHTDNIVHITGGDERRPPPAEGGRVHARIHDL